MKISFDFDKTLERYRLKNLAIALHYAGHEVWIVTRRVEYNDSLINYDLVSVALDCMIDDNRIIMCEKEKHHYLHDFDIHFDDDPHEVNEINFYTNCKAVLI